jgi:hypothetical protein
VPIKQDVNTVDLHLGTKLSAALNYARRGLAVFPLKSPAPRLPDGRDPSKWPRIRKDQGGRGHLDATTDDKIITRWWSEVPDGNIGIATGAVSGFWVIDVDPKHGGIETIKALQRKYGGIPQDVMVATAGGGWHIYIWYDPGAPVGSHSNRIGPDGVAPYRELPDGDRGVDVRGDGGYVVAPPSRNCDSKAYTWLNGADVGRDHPAPLPPIQWLNLARAAGATEHRFNSATSHPGSDHWADLIASGVPEGGRNSAAASLVGHLLGHGLSGRETLALMRLWNDHRCHPPLSDEELNGLIRSITGRQARRVPA